MKQPAIAIRSCRGMTMFELIAAAAMLGVLLASAAQVMRVLATQQKAIARRTMALETVQAVAEELGNTPWEELTPEAANKLTLPEVSQRFLPGATLKTFVVEGTEPVATKRLSIELNWNAANGQPAKPTRLTTWVFPETENLLGRQIIEEIDQERTEGAE